MVVQGPALSRAVAALSGTCPLQDFWEDQRCPPALPASIWELPAWGAQCQDTLLTVALGRGMGGRTRQEWVFHQELILTWPPTAPASPGWDCAAGEGGFTCLGFFCRKNGASLAWVACDRLQVLFSPIRGELTLQRGWLVECLCRNFKCKATFSSRCGCWAWQSAAASKSCWKPLPPAEGNMKEALHQNEIINCCNPGCSFKRCMSASNPLLATEIYQKDTPKDFQATGLTYLKIGLIKWGNSLKSRWFCWGFSWVNLLLKIWRPQLKKNGQKEKKSWLK